MKSSIAFFCLYLFTLTGMGQTQEGEASYYKSTFEGRKTASGDLYQQDLPTAAHRTLPLGSIVNITNRTNGKSAKVVINDRGPYIRNRIIDVSLSVAKRLGFELQGKTLVEIKVLEFENRATAFAEHELYEITKNQIEPIEVAVQDTVTTEAFIAANEPKETQVVDPVKEEKLLKKKEDVVRIIEEKPTKTNAEIAEFSKKEEESKVNKEVIDLVQKVSSPKNEAAAKEVKKEKTNKANTKVVEEKVEKQLPVENLNQKLTVQINKQPTKEQFFNLDAERIDPDYLSVQVASLSDAKNTLDLGQKLQEFYKETILLRYKLINNKGLYSLAIGKVENRADAEILLAKIKDRYPYAFILDLKD